MSALASPTPVPRAAQTPSSYLAIAAATAVVAQVAFVALFAAGDHADIRADLDAPAQAEMAVAIDAVSDLPLLKLGAEKPSKTAAYGRPRAKSPTRAASAPGAAAPSLPAPPLLEGAEPANPADEPVAAPSTAKAATSADLGADPGLADAGPTAAAAATTPGSALGSDAGTEIDPLKGRAVASYRAQLDGWFSARFHIRGKLPFERLEKLAASVVVSVANRHVVSFVLSSPSGDATFDAQLRSDLNAIQTSGVELPAPPPTHPELLGATVSLRFACSLRAYCE
jgi:hypothetical protein